MGRASRSSLKNGQDVAEVSHAQTPSTGANVRIHSGDLQGIDGVVIGRRGRGRLLIRLRSMRGICVEIDANVVEFVSAAKR